jgi:serine/threonine protein kinase
MAIRTSVLDQKYDFEYDVGQWTFGSISVIRHRQSSELRTCKKIPKSLVADHRSALNKLKTLRELQHPHVATILDVMEDHTNLYLITEFLQGGEVSDWVERLQDGYVIQEQTCAAYVRQAMLAMMHCHAAQVYHGALLPSSLSLTSKMPDASIKVADFGLAAILDPNSTLMQRNRSPYTAPEVTSGHYSFVDGSSDMYSIGAIAHALLVGRAPGRPQNGGFLSRKGNGNELSWSERSPMSRDFVMQLLQGWEERPTPARALQHPWLKGASQSINGVIADRSAEADIQQKTLCYMLAVLMLPNSLPYRDFEQLRTAFQDNDQDADGLVPRHIVKRVLRSRCALKEAVDAAITISDVNRSEVHDLCSTAVADLIAREFFAAGPTGQPLQGPFRAGDLAPRMMKRFFESLKVTKSSVSASTLQSRLKTATARDIQKHTEVNYEEVLSLFPGSGSLNAEELGAVLAASEGRGTPLATGYFGTEQSEGFDFNDFNLNIFNLFGQCGLGNHRRDRSPHSILVR